MNARTPLTVNLTNPRIVKSGSLTEYLTILAKAYPDRDESGCIIGYYVHEGDRRVTGALTTREEAEAVIEAGWVTSDGTRTCRVVADHVTTASGRPVKVIE